MDIVLASNVPLTTAQLLQGKGVGKTKLPATAAKLAVGRRRSTTSDSMTLEDRRQLGLVETVMPLRSTVAVQFKVDHGQLAGTSGVQNVMWTRTMEVDSKLSKNDNGLMTLRVQSKPSSVIHSLQQIGERLPIHP